MTKIIYLDQNKWSSLFKQDKGIRKDEDIGTALQKIREASENGDAIFPVSIVNLIETARFGRKELFDFMYEISNSFYLAPFTVAEEEEFRNYLAKKENKNHAPLETRIIGLGLHFAFGGRHYQFTNYSNHEIPEKLLAKMEESLSSKKAYDLLKEPEILQKMNDRSLEEQITGQIKKDIKRNERKYNSNRKRRRESIVKYYFHNIASPLMYRAIDRQIELGKVTANLGSYLQNGEDSEAHDFMLEFPSNYVRSNLIISRNIQHSGNEPVDANDLNDIMSLSVAIAHCDMVLTENFWTNVATNDTNLSSNLETKVANDFKPIIAEL